jgi:RimJ/RimL family protein N-acetyltransferase
VNSDIRQDTKLLKVHGADTCDFILAIPEPSHIEKLDALLNDPAISRWLGGQRSSDAILHSIESERQHWLQHGFGPWVVMDRVSGTIVGRGGLRHAQVRAREEVELFYAVTPRLWGKGIATGIGRAALDVAFLQRRLPSVVAFTIETNKASLRVLEKLCFTQETLFEHAGLPHILFRRVRPSGRKQRQG